MGRALSRIEWHNHCQGCTLSGDKWCHHRCNLTSTADIVRFQLQMRAESVAMSTHRQLMEIPNLQVANLPS